MILFAVVGIMLTMQAPGSVPQQDAPQSAAIHGAVVDSATGAPIERAVVTLTRPGTFTGTQAVTDAEGRFTFKELAPGQFSLSATAGEFIATHAPYRTPGGTRPLVAGEVRQIRVPLRRAAVISGRVVDETGVPMSGVRVRLRDLSTGFEHHADFRRRTDDLGAFRVFGLPPGRYIVCATVDGGPTFRSQPKPRLKVVETCYPSATEERDATATSVASGEEVDGLEIRMQRRATFTISGTIVDSTGRPAEAPQLTLMHVKGNGWGGSGQRVDRGRFTISDVVPGRYVLRAEIGPPRAPNSPPPIEAGVVDLGFVSANVDDIVVTTKKAVSVRGVVTFEDGTPPDAQNQKLRIEPQSGSRWFASRRATADVRPDFTFEVQDLIGPHTLALAGLPAGSAVRSIRYRGRDIAHVPTEFDGDPRHVVEVVVTRRLSELSGRVVDASGNPAAPARIYFFPEDPARWPGWSRGAARSNAGGSYRIRSLVSGDYLALAISEQDLKEITSAEWYRPNPYARLATLADRVTLLDNDRRVVDLRVTPIPQEWKR